MKRVDRLWHSVAILPETGSKEGFLPQIISAGNIALCREQNVACELQVGYARSTILIFFIWTATFF